MSLIKGSIFGIYVGLTKFHVRVDFFGSEKFSKKILKKFSTSRKSQPAHEIWLTPRKYQK